MENSSKNCLVAALSVAVASFGFSVFAVNSTSFEPAADVGTSVLSPAVWEASANWKDELAPETDDQVEVPEPESGIRYAKLTGAKTYSYIRLYGSTAKSFHVPSDSPAWILFSDDKVTLNQKNSIGKAVIQNVCLYAPLEITCDSSYHSYLTMCAPLTCAGTLSCNTSFSHLYDRYALSSDSLRANEGLTGTYALSSADLLLNAPQSSAADVVGVWSRTAQSAYATFAGSGAVHVIPVGTLVEGDGIEAGTFVKRIFPGSVIELSQAATATASGNLTFKAFSPKIRQSISCIQTSTFRSYLLYFQKFRPEDEMIVELGALTLYGKAGSDFGSAKITCGAEQFADWAYPARTRIGKVARASTAYASTLILGTCELEFTDYTVGKQAYNGVPGIPVTMNSAADRATIVATNGVETTLLVVSNLVGTVVKKGDGRLNMGLEAESSGSIEVAEGTLAVNGYALADGVRPTVARLSIAKDAVLSIPASGLRVKELTVADGAIVDGEGTLLVDNTFDFTRLTVRGSVVIELAGSDAAFDYGKPAAGTLATVTATKPAYWFDFSDESSLTLNAAGTYIERIDDRRGSAFGHAARSGSYRGAGVQKNSAGKIVSAYFNHEAQNALVWDRKLTEIRSVFKVTTVCDTPGGTPSGGGSFLACWDEDNAWGYRAKQYSTIVSWMQPIFDLTLGNACPAISNGTFVANGEVRDWRKGYPYDGLQSAMKDLTIANAGSRCPMVVEFHTADGLAGPAADNFSKGLKYNGGQSSCEYLIYTNVLTEAEKRTVRDYLMRKWVAAEADWNDIPAETDCETLAPNGNRVSLKGNLRVKSLTGDGTLVKAGAGTLSVDDVTGGASLTVEAGDVTVKSIDVATDAADVLAGAAVRFDATATSSIVTSGDCVTEWKDVRGTGYRTATRSGTGSWPIVVADGINGHPAVDFGPETIGSSQGAALAFSTSLDTVRTAFSVLGPRTCGGPLIGWSGSGTSAAKGDSINPNIAGLFGGFADGASDPTKVTAIRAGLFSGWIKSDVIPSVMIQMTDGPGCARLRVNGVRVNTTNAVLPRVTGDVVSYATYAPVKANRLALAMKYGSANLYSGGQELGEQILFTNALAQSDVTMVEAYLSKKWLGRETAGCRPARLGALTVAAGATVTAYGSAPITVSSLSGAGQVNGSLACAANAVIDVTVNADGSIAPLALTGALDLSSGVTVRLVGATKKLQVGSWPLVTAAGGVTSGAMTLEAEGVRKGRRLSLEATGANLVLNVTRRGVAVFVR